MEAEIAFTAMGTDCRVVVAGTAPLADAGRARIDELERRWSRFRADSEISQLNRAAGRPTAPSPIRSILRSF